MTTNRHVEPINFLQKYPPNWSSSSTLPAASLLFRSWRLLNLHLLFWDTKSFTLCFCPWQVKSNLIQTKGKEKGETPPVLRRPRAEVCLQLQIFTSGSYEKHSRFCFKSVLGLQAMKTTSMHEMEKPKPEEKVLFVSYLNLCIALF